MFNIETGQDDEHPLGGDIGEQASAPYSPMPPPPGQAPGPEAPGPAMPTDNTVMAPSPSVLPAPIPQISPYSPQPPAPVPVSRVVTPAESANLGALDKNAAARMQTAQDQGGINTQAAGLRATAADQQNEDQQRFLQERQRISDDATKRIQERQQQANADFAQYKNFGIKDPEADQSFATRILKAIAVGMGGYASGMNGGPNQALSIIQEANKANIDRQKAQQEKLFRVAEQSGKNVEQAKQDRDDAFRQLDLKHSALLESSAAMLRDQLAKLGVPQAQIDANRDLQTLEKDSLNLREKTLADIRDDETSLARADIAAAGRRAKRGAGGGGSVRSEALSKFAEAAGALKPGDSIPPDLVVLGARAGLKPNQIAGEIQRYRDSGNKSQGGADKADETAFKTYVGSYLKNSDELKRRVAALNSADAGARNPKASYGEVISALESGIAADAGAGVRGVSMGQLHSIIPNLVSAEGKISNAVSQNWDGTVGNEFRAATLRFIQRAKTERTAEMREAGDRAEKDLAATPYGQRNPDFAKRGRERLYPNMSTSGGGADPRVGLARKAIADPNASTAVKARALQILRAAGE